MLKNPYETLGVEQSASHEEIQKAYREKSLEHHPDLGGDVEKFKEIEEAASILLDQEKRARFDSNGFYKPPPTKKELWSLLSGMIIDECGGIDSNPSSFFKSTLYGSASTDVILAMRKKIEATGAEHGRNVIKLERRIKHWRRVLKSFERQNKDKTAESYARFVDVVNSQIEECTAAIHVSKYKVEFGVLAIAQLEGIRFVKEFREEESDQGLESISQQNRFIS